MAAKLPKGHAKRGGRKQVKGFSSLEKKLGIGGPKIKEVLGPPKRNPRRPKGVAASKLMRPLLGMI